jgi:hypothetical protein
MEGYLRFLGIGWHIGAPAVGCKMVRLHHLEFSYLIIYKTNNTKSTSTKLYSEQFLHFRLNIEEFN